LNDIFYYYYGREILDVVLNGTSVFVFWEGDRTPHKVLLKTKHWEVTITDNPLLAILLLRMQEYADWLHSRLA
jgi:hypothetical protein